MMPWYLDSDDPEVLKKQRFRRDMAQLLSYLLVVSLFVFYAWNDSREDKEKRGVFKRKRLDRLFGIR